MELCWPFLNDDDVWGVWRWTEGGFGCERRGLIDLYRIQTWALEEARRRLEAEGILKEPESKS